MLPFSQWQVLTHPRPGSLLAPPTGKGGPPSPELQSLNAERLEEDRRAVEGLATTSLLSMAMGVLGAFRAKGERSRAFHVTSTAVHLFVLGTAVAGRVAIEAQDPKRLGTEDSVQRGSRLLRLLKAGMASDVGAMTAGTLSLLGARWRRHDGLSGAGTALLLHGAMLLLFDTGLYLRNAYHQRRVLEKVGRS